MFSLFYVTTLFLFPLQSTAAKSFDQTSSYVRIIHASPYVGTADVFVDGSPLLSAFQFAATTDYVPVPSGNHKVQIALLGKGINASLITQYLDVQPGTAYTVAAIGATPDKLGLQVFQDDNTAIVNHAKVRIYHLTADAKNVIFTVGEENSVNNVHYLQASAYITEDAGPCDILFKDAQTNTSLPITVNLTANMVTSIFAIGLVNGNPKAHLVSAQTTGLPGLPQTGNPPVLADLVRPLAPWLFLAITLAFLGTGMLYRMRRIRIS